MPQVYDDKLLSVRKVAELLDCAPNTVRALIDQGDIGAILISPSSSQRRHFRVRSSEVARYINEVGVYEPDLG